MFVYDVPIVNENDKKNTQGVLHNCLSRGKKTSYGLIKNNSNNKKKTIWIR